MLLGLVSWAPDIYNVFADPLISALPPGVSMIATDVVAPFFVPIKVTFFVAFIISLPFSLWQIWSFVEPALYSEEKKLALPVVLSSFLLFWRGWPLLTLSCFQLHSVLLLLFPHPKLR